MIRSAFWNVYAPGCSEHYLAHTMRAHPDFIPELDFVLELDGKIVGNIMYTKARLRDESGNQKQILTFGPLGILPEYQGRGYGRQLVDHSLQRAKELGHSAVVIFGSPERYVGSGFVSCKRHNISLPGGAYPTAMLVRILKSGVLEGGKWTYEESSAMEFDETKVAAFDQGFEPLVKAYRPSQESFYILSHSTLNSQSC